MKLAIAALLSISMVDIAETRAEKRPEPIDGIRGVLLDDNSGPDACGVMEVWTILHFDVSADPKKPSGTAVDAKRLPIAIPCAGMPRPMYSKTAGNAGKVTKGKAYRLTLAAPGPGKWGTKHAWAAKKIDDAK